MLYINRTLNLAVEHTDRTTIDAWSAAGQQVQSRSDWRKYEQVKDIADALNGAAGSLRFLPCDHGAHVHPRFDIVPIPQIGDKVSYTYNGDTYPDGEVVRVGPTAHRIATSTGNVYHRGVKGGYWVLRGVWVMVPGHVSTTNRDL